jgi:hypothetical protein
MTQHDNDTLPAEDRAWLERVRAAYAPPALTPGRAAAFDVALRERIEARGRRGTLWVPASALAAAALAIWLGTALWGAASPAPQEAQLAGTWESELILGRDVAPRETRDYLPEDYVVIADAFLSE